MRFLRITALIALLGTSVMAAGALETPRAVRAVLEKNPDKCVVYGTVVDANANPIPSATVRLRNLQSKAIEQVMMSSRAGEFAFPALPDTPYVVELVDRPGHVVVVGDVASAPVKEFSTTILVAPPVSAMNPAVFQASAGSIVSAVLGAGLAVLESPAPPVSPEK